MPLLAGFGVNYLSLAVCSICCLSTALFMQRTRQLTVENRELQARLALMVIQNGRAGKGLEPDFSVDNSTQDLLVAQVVQCLQQAAHTTAEGQQHYCKSDIDGNQEEEILEPYSLDLAARALAGVMLMALLVGTWLTFRHLDALPNWMKRIGFSLLGGLPRGSEAVQQKMGSIPLSKLLAYRLDRWFSSNPYSKVLCRPSLLSPLLRFACWTLLTDCRIVLSTLADSGASLYYPGDGLVWRPWHLCHQHCFPGRCAVGGRGWRRH